MMQRARIVIRVFIKAIHIKILNINPSVNMPYQGHPKGAHRAKLARCKGQFVRIGSRKKIMTEVIITFMPI